MPSKWPQYPLASTASWKQIEKIAQFNPEASSLGMVILQPFDKYLTETLNDPQHLCLFRLSDIFCDRLPLRTPLLKEFFNDPSHSGLFYLDGDKYATFAIYFTKHLIAEMYMCESVKYTFTSHSHLLVNAVHILGRPSFFLNLNTTCLLCPFYCHRHHIQETLQPF